MDRELTRDGEPATESTLLEHTTEHELATESTLLEHTTEHELATESTLLEHTTVAPDVEQLGSTEVKLDRSPQLQLPLIYPNDMGLGAPPKHIEPPRSNRFRRSLVLADAVAVLVGAALTFAIWMLLYDIPPTIEFEHALLFVVSYPVWIAMFMITRLYVSRIITGRADEFRRIWAACAMSTIIVVFIAFAVQYPTLSRAWVTILLITTASVLVIERAVARRVFARLRRTGRMSRRVAIIGSGPDAISMHHRLGSDPSLGYSVVGLIGEQPAEHSDAAWLGHLAEAESLLVDHQCSGAMLSLASLKPTDVNYLVRRLTDQGFHIALSSSLRDIDMTRIRPQSIDGQALLYVEPVIRDGWRARAKRMFDIGLAGVATMLSAPVILIAAALIKIDSPGPVFFRQSRVGRDGVPFEMMKLRTMRIDAEDQLDAILTTNERTGPLFKSAVDPRITRVGAVLRKWSVDEIPQFYNVLRGDMSVVGPRPALPREVAKWDPETRERLRALPGITGLWQVKGRGNESFDVYKRLDLFYVDNWSLLHDLRIVSLTFGAVITRRGAV